MKNIIKKGKIPAIFLFTILIIIVMISLYFVFNNFSFESSANTKSESKKYNILSKIASNLFGKSPINSKTTEDYNPASLKSFCKDFKLYSYKYNKSTGLYLRFKSSKTINKKINISLDLNDSNNKRLKENLKLDFSTKSRYIRTSILSSSQDYLNLDLPLSININILECSKDIYVKIN